MGGWNIGKLEGALEEVAIWLGNSIACVVTDVAQRPGFILHTAY